MTRRPLPVRPSVQARDSVGARRRRALIATTATIVFALAAVAASAEPGEIAARRAEVRQVLQQIQELDGELGHAVEAYNAANVRLEEIEHEREHNRRTLRIARRNLALEQRALARRLVAIYMSEDDLSGVGVILGATSLSDLLDRTDTVTAVERVDTRVAEEVKRFKKTIESQKRRLARAHERQGEIVAARAAAKAEIEGRLAERRRLVASIRSEIERLEAEERARQERLAREARERLARQRAAERAARLRAAEGASTSSGAYVPSAGLDGSAVGVVASTPDGSVVPESGRGGDVVAIAMQYLGVPYVWGGASPSGFDCSGFVMYVYAQVGVSLPHYTVSQYQLGIPVSSDQLQPGDLVFFNGLGHMGIYIGGGQFIHAPHTGDVVKISSLSDSWYAATYVGARRLL